MFKKNADKSGQIRNVADSGTVGVFLCRYRGTLTDLFLCALVINFFALLLPLFSSFVYDKILGNGIYDTLWALVIGMGLAAVIEFAVRQLRVTVAERLAVCSDADIDGAVFEKLLGTRLNKMPAMGTFLEKYKQIVGNRDFLSSSYLLALADLPYILVFISVIALVAGPLVLVGLLCGGIMLLTAALLTPSILAADRDAKDASEQRFGLLTDVLSSREAIVGQALADDLTHKWQTASQKAAAAHSLARYWRGLNMTVANSLSFLSFVGVLAGGVYLVEHHLLTSGGLLAASMLTSRMMGCFSSVTTLVLRYRELTAALRDVNAMLPTAERGTFEKPRRQIQGALRLNHVGCRLQDDAPFVLKDVSLTIRAGEIVGIAGAPGAGKTTLLRLLTGNLVADEGQVYLDDILLADIAAADLATALGYKPQDLCLFDGTIEENVRAGRPMLSAEARQAVLSASGLGRAFQENALSWTTEVGARGSKLSGGQRQLVALARALLNDPKILILDEPTNGLDAPLETHLANYLASLRGKRTVIVSSHSRQILSICDRIVVVGQSRLLADGPREKILAG